jgi:hypothetical protein
MCEAVLVMAYPLRGLEMMTSWPVQPERIRLIGEDGPLWADGRHPHCLHHPDRSTADRGTDLDGQPLIFAAVFSAMFSARLWGAKRLAPYQIHWPTAFALRISRVPVGVACMWWLVSRQTLDVEVTPEGGSNRRIRGPCPRILWALTALLSVVIAYALFVTLHRVPWTPALHRPQLPGCG